MEIEAPAGAADEELSVEWGEDAELDGIKKPYGFRQIGKPYRFGPHGLHFSEGKGLHIKIRFKPDELQGYPVDAVQLYYINTKNKRLEPVPDQYVDAKQKILEAGLTYFSSYVAGVEPSWNGTGLNPYIDYVNNGEEHVLIANRSLTILAPIYSIKSRGLDINLNRAYNSNSEVDIYNPFTINKYWYFALPYIANYRLYLSNGASYRFSVPATKDYSNRYFNYGELKIKVVGKLNGFLPQIDMVYLNDGTSIRFQGDSQIVSDSNGNWVQYDFKVYNNNDVTSKRIYRITDSTGHIFNFKYEMINNEPVFKNITQKLADGSLKSILTFSNSFTDALKLQNSFTDALNRTTTYHYDYYDSESERSQISKINYPNGLVSSYNYQSGSGVTSQIFTRPGSSISARTVTYTASMIDLLRIKVTINDGTCKKIYYLTNLTNDLTILTHEAPEAPGYTKYVETYTSSGKLLKRVDYSYQYIKNNYYDGNSQDYYEFAIPLKVTTTPYRANGSPGTPAAYEYTYDDWNNITMLKDPYGTITRMAYTNTNSNKNLSQLDSRLQNYRSDFSIATAVPCNRLLTKATIITDPAHNNAVQLKQTHYKYDSRGNLTQESEVYGGSYLNTTYAYDNYGNMTSKTDANNNQLCYEYNTTNNAYLSRVYHPEKGTIATYDYSNGGFDIGKPTTFTDPQNNSFSYTYDAIGRLTGETLNNPDPKVGVTRKISYNDAQSLVNLEFGNNQTGWQYG